MDFIDLRFSQTATIARLGVMFAECFLNYVCHENTQIFSLSGQTLNLYFIGQNSLEIFSGRKTSCTKILVFT